jgi:hypothetical protein
VLCMLQLAVQQILQLLERAIVECELSVLRAVALLNTASICTSDIQRVIVWLSKRRGNF